MFRKLTLALFLVCVGLTLESLSSAQLSLGTVTASGDPYACSGAVNGSKFYAGMQCINATISGCTGVDPINITYGFTGPAAPTVPQGTIVFFSGSGGQEPTENGDDIPAYAPVYVNLFEIVFVEYHGGAWEDPNNGAGGNILQAACRPATFLKYINDSNIRQGAMCAQGFSAGSAALAYSMSYYGAGNYLKNAEFLAGPVLSEIDQGCTYPSAGMPTVCPSGGYCSPATQPWSDDVIYVTPNNTAVSTWSGINHCAASGYSSNDLKAWKGMSIVDGSLGGVTPVFSFPSVKKHGWLCSTLNQICPGGGSCANNSSAQGKYFTMP